ncbi:MAG: DUF4012 domain-containing protein [Candidatus Moraniibacteriota bacterium]
MSSPFKRQPSQISDIRSAPRSPVFVQPDTARDYREERRVPDVPCVLAPDTEQVPFRARSHGTNQHASFFAGKRRLLLIGVAVSVVGAGILLLVEVAQEVRNTTVAEGERGYQDLALAVGNLQAERFGEAVSQFDDASQAFAHGTESLSAWGGSLLDVTRFVPGLSQIASGKSALEAGKHFAVAGTVLANIAADLASSKEAYAQGEKISLLDFLARTRAPLRAAVGELEAGNQALENVNIAHIPSDQREKFLLVRKSLPTLIGLIKNFDQHQTLFEELLGGNGPRKYLFLFQNNQEMRATGGFIGSYALMDVNNGAVRRFFVDGIFNPDGQLRENIVPPKAIQKVSAAWSLHDSNWFPDFPVSAEKAIFFYEKTGGPTVDGVITLTPTVMQKLLAVTGPIPLPQYGLVVDSDNFIPVIQEQVETNYDKEENQPKKILADLTALLMEKAFALQDKTALYRVANALVEGLNEKQMLLYMRHPATEKLIDDAGWSGRVLPAFKDYLSVIHTNINGYKTDGVIDEAIKHTAEISADGSIIDTVAITRTHRGGHTQYDWWNRVNADYLRVYVPEGSMLLSAKGATWEFPAAPLDYQALGFRSDADVDREEHSLVIDEKSGTRVYRDAGKTVFGAWVYVSPQESVMVEYRYSLPFKIDMDQIRRGETDSYAVLYQKQSGSLGSKLMASVVFPQGIGTVWQTSGNLLPYGRQWNLDTDLRTDVFAGMVFGATK